MVDNLVIYGLQLFSGIVMTGLLCCEWSCQQTIIISCNKQTEKRSVLYAASLFDLVYSRHRNKSLSANSVEVTLLQHMFHATKPQLHRETNRPIGHISSPKVPFCGIKYDRKLYMLQEASVFESKVQC